MRIADWDAPGRIFCVVAVVLAASVLFADSDLNWLLFFALLLPCFALAVIWLVRFAATIFWSRLRLPVRTWLRWLGIPAMGLLCAALVVNQAPFRLRFELSRSAFQEATQRVEAGYAIPDGQIGSFHSFYNLELRNGVFFALDPASFRTYCGPAYSREGQPDIQHVIWDLGGGWWWVCD